MDVERILRKTLKPALGCTEPVAVALGVAAAVQATAGWMPGNAAAPIRDLPAASIESVRVAVNRNIFKNAFSIYIPNAGGHKGILMAAAMGAWCDPGAGLELFRDVSSQDVVRARELIDAGKVSIDIVEAEETDLYIEARVRLGSGSEGREGVARIRDEHTNLTFLECDGREIFSKNPGTVSVDGMTDELREMAALEFRDLVKMADELQECVHPLLWQTIELNRKAAETGLEQPLGLGIGYYGLQTAERQNCEGFLDSSAAAGSDARMSGYPVEVMSSAGSGNQGIIATMPIYAYCRENRIDETRMLRAIALAHLVTLYITLHVGYLSSLCGVAIKAGIGAACGITYAMGGGELEIHRAVKIMAATLSGMLCDGAKPGCALKVSSSSDMAVRAASMAMKNVDVSDENGIVGDTAESTIRNLALLNQSMHAVEDKIIQILQEKITRPGPPAGSRATWK